MRPTRTRTTFEHSFAFRSYGVRIKVLSNDARFLGRLQRAIPGAIGSNVSPIVGKDHDLTFRILHVSDGTCEIHRNEEPIGKNIGNEAILSRSAAELKLTIAEHAKDHVFVHAGAVGWKGKGIIIPARSFKGKSTLTAELVRLGARYYSDEYAVLDKRGLLRPLANDLSMRGGVDPFQQKKRTLESIGGEPGKRAIPVRLIVITEFDKDGHWDPKMITAGNAAMEILNNTVPIRTNPTFVVPIVTIVSAGAIAVTSVRGEASVTAKKILGMLDKIETT